MAGVHELRRIVAFDEMEEELQARGLVGVEAALPGMMDFSFTFIAVENKAKSSKAFKRSRGGTWREDAGAR